MFGMQGVPPNNYTQLEYRDRLEKCGESLFHKSNPEPRVRHLLAQILIRQISYHFNSSELISLNLFKFDINQFSIDIISEFL